MKQKLFALLLLLALSITSSRVAFAQEQTPPNPSDDARLAPESSFWFPNSNPRPKAIKTTSNESFTPATNYHPDAANHAAPLAVMTSSIVNGNFEQGAWVGWSEYSSNGYDVVVPYAPPGVTPHSGNWIAWLGDENYEYTTLSQSSLNIFSPSTLRLWYWLGSSDDCGYDYGFVKINTNIIYTWNLCYTNNTYGWTPLDINLDAYSGQTVNLSIDVQTDVGYLSGLLIDDISLYGSFADVAYGYWAGDYIRRLYDAGITGGCGGTPQRYCPETQVTRAQMAVFLLKGIHGSSYTPPAPGASTGFGDVPISYWAAPWIKQLAAEGTTAGCGNGNFCPDFPVNRAQMAVFLLKAKHGSAYIPPSATGMFADVDPATHFAASWIEQLAAEGITAGCGGGNYCPNQVVNRAQMAVFLVKTFNLP